MAARLGIKAKPRFFYDLLIRTSSAGDLFGLRKGLSFKKLVEQHPEGITLRDSLPTRLFEKKFVPPTKRSTWPPANWLLNWPGWRKSESCTMNMPSV